MDLQTILDNKLEKARAEEMKTSAQLVLAELILKLEAVGNKNLPVKFDGPGHYPTCIDSWRGSYCELALNHRPDREERLSVWDVVALLKRSIGATFHGYKGGLYKMGKTTPVWVASYGDDMGFREDAYTAVVDVKEETAAIIIVTAGIDYLAEE